MRGGENKKWLKEKKQQKKELLKKLLKKQQKNELSKRQPKNEQQKKEKDKVFLTNKSSIFIKVLDKKSSLQMD